MKYIEYANESYAITYFIKPLCLLASYLKHILDVCVCVCVKNTLTETDFRQVQTSLGDSDIRVGSSLMFLTEK